MAGLWMHMQDAPTKNELQEAMQIREYKFYQEYTGTLGCLRKPLSEHDESHLMRTVFGHAQVRCMVCM